jgi:hypothetical protein
MVGKRMRKKGRKTRGETKDANAVLSHENPFQVVCG